MTGTNVKDGEHIFFTFCFQSFIACLLLGQINTAALQEICSFKIFVCQNLIIFVNFRNNKPTRKKQNPFSFPFVASL